MLLSTSPPLKVGRGIHGDAKLMRAQFGAEFRGLTELASKHIGLKGMASKWTSLEPPGGASGSKTGWMTDWDARALPKPALAYAAFDAVAAYEIFSEMPPTPAAAP